MPCLGTAGWLSPSSMLSAAARSGSGTHCVLRAACCSRSRAGGESLGGAGGRRPAVRRGHLREPLGGTRGGGEGAGGCAAARRRAGAGEAFRRDWLPLDLGRETAGEGATPEEGPVAGGLLRPRVSRPPPPSPKGRPGARTSSEEASFASCFWRQAKLACLHFVGELRSKRHLVPSNPHVSSPERHTEERLSMSRFVLLGE